MMDRVVLPVILGSLLLCGIAPFPCRAQFEGVVESKNLTRDETGRLLEFVMTMWIKKDMVKVTNSAIGPTPGSTMIYRNDRRSIWILNDDGKTYYAIPNETPAGESYPPPAGAKTETYVIKRTRKTRRILGYPAEQVIITQAGQKTEIWGTAKLRNLSVALSSTLGGRQSEPGDGWAGELAKMGIFPLMSSTSIYGKVAESQEVTRIEERILPQEIFEVPATYKEQRPDKMLRSLQQPK